MRSFHYQHSNGLRASMHPKHVISLLIVIAILLLVLLTLFPRAAAAGGQAQATILKEGQQEYSENCAYCHGSDGTGEGRIAPVLVKPPKDLTAITSANDGQFPFWRIFEIIAGESPVEGHDTHQMPDFFASLKAQDFKPGYLPAHIRVLELTHYLESIQKK